MRFPRFSQEIYLRHFFKFDSKHRHKVEFEDLYLFDSGVSSLVSLLRSAYGNSKITVGLPAYSCFSLINAIVSSGYSVRPIDIIVDSVGYHFDLEALRDLDCFVFIHFFGFYFGGLSRIVARFPRLFLVEDCSHCNYFTTPTSMNPQFFSFALHKPTSYGVGGGVRWRSKPFAEYCSKNKRVDNDRLYLSLFFGYVKSCLFNKLFFSICECFGFSNLSKQNELAPVSSPLTLPDCFYSLLMAKCNSFSSSMRLSHYHEISERNRIGLQTPCFSNIYVPVLFPDQITLESFQDYCRQISIETFVLWNNLESSLNTIGHSLAEYPMTRRFLSTTVFLPTSFLKDLGLRRSVLKFWERRLSSNEYSID